MSVSVQQMKYLEQRLIESGAVTAAALMEKAGIGLSRIALDTFKSGNFDKISIITGKGNNGGDGYVAARILKCENVPVEVIAVELPIGGLAKKKRSEYIEIGGIITSGIDCDNRFDKRTVVIDCMLGIGIKGALNGIYKKIAEIINDSGAFIISCDMPSGLSDNGRSDLAVNADITVAIGAEKDAYYLNDGLDYSGIIRLIDIGIDTSGYERRLTDNSLIESCFPKRKRNTHKGSYGSAAIIACSADYPGAGKLSAAAAVNTVGESALRSGVGLVRLIVPKALMQEFRSVAISCSLGVIDEIGKYRFSAAAYGMGVGNADAGVLKALIDKKLPLLIDADGLNILSANTELLDNAAKNKILITPHVKEMSALTGLGVNEILNDPINTAEEFARKYGVIVLLKGCGTVITDGNQTYLNAVGSPCLAKGGSGDVLSGIIAALMAKGVSPLTAGAAGAYILGKASYIAEKRYGENGTLPTDVAEAVNDALKNCGR